MNKITFNLEKKMKKVLLMLIFASVIVTGCGSKEEKRTRVKSHYNVSVKVLGANETGPIRGAQVRLKYDDIVDGKFSSDYGTVDFENIKSRDYVIEISADGYNESQIEIDELNEDKEYVIALVPEITNDDAMVLVSWNGDQDIDLCAFNSKVSEYINIGHPVDSEQNVFLYADHGSSEPFELLYIHNASDEFKRTIYVTDSEMAKEGSPSRMEDDGVTVSVYTNKGLIYSTTASQSETAPIWCPIYIYAGNVYEQQEYISDTTKDEFSWVNYDKTVAVTDTNSADTNVDQNISSTSDDTNVDQNISSASDDSWKEAYLEFINLVYNCDDNKSGDYSDDFYKYFTGNLIYIDDDDIPELIISYTDNWSGCPIVNAYSYHNGEIQYMVYDTSGGMTLLIDSYIEKSGKICYTSHDHYGNWDISIDVLSNSGFENDHYCAHHEDWGEETYYIDDEECDHEVDKYDLSAYYDFSKAKDVNATKYTYSELVDYLSN